MFTGGRGRFEGATGSAVIVAETEPVSSDGSLSGETGTTVGTIVLVMLALALVCVEWWVYNAKVRI